MIGRGVIAVIRTASADAALTIGRGLAVTAVAGIEITMTVPGAPAVIATLIAEGVTRVGAGTVRTLAEVEACVEAGAEFLVSPHLDPALVKAGLSRGVDVVPGALTPSEIVHAMACGASAVKVFPVSAMGGVPYVRSVLEPLPDARIVVSGEVQPSEAGDYLAAGAMAACIGRALWLGADVDGGDVDSVTTRAEHVLRSALA